MNVIPIKIPETFVIKHNIKKDGQITTDFLIVGQVKNTPFAIQINQFANKNILNFFANKNIANFAVHKYHRYNTNGGIRIYYALLEENNQEYCIPIIITNETDNILLNILIAQANIDYNLDIEKDKCRNCGRQLNKYEKQFDNWQLCSECHSKETSLT